MKNSMLAINSVITFMVIVALFITILEAFDGKPHGGMAVILIVIGLYSVLNILGLNE